jgi:glycosyltransferase involved in cell wall biosynthesis
LRFGVVAPNIGLEMGRGGGTRTALYMARALCEAGHHVNLVAMRGLSLAELEIMHQTGLGAWSESIETSYLLDYESSLRIPFPLQVMLFRNFLASVLDKRHLSAVIFNDDVPRGVIEERSIPYILYSHFPYAVRVAYNVRDPYEIAPKGIAHFLDRTYRKILRRLIYVSEQPPPNGQILANSTITRDFIKMIWPSSHPEILFPPCEPPGFVTVQPFEKKDNLAVVLGALQPNKRIGDVIEAFAKVRSGMLIVVGYGDRKSSYTKYLVSKLSGLGMQKRVILELDASEETKWKILERSKVIVSAAHFEPFGINVLEGMFAGALPVVYEGNLSGPWVDITDFGRYGLGYRTTDELASHIKRAFSFESGYRGSNSGIHDRAAGFGYTAFKNHFLRIVDEMGS